MTGIIVVPAFWGEYQTDRLTRSGQLFSTEPPEEIFVHRTFNAKAFERSFSTILDNVW